ncbi:MAG: DUF1365 family protein [Pseudomonadota bacterium]
MNSNRNKLEFQSSLYSGKVMHRRHYPRDHRFVYKVDSWCIDLDELENLDKELPGFSWNRFNLFSFHNKDHGDADGSCLRAYVENVCTKSGIAKPASIKLLCYPRILGFAFNPLSVYFCANSDGHPIATRLAQ